MPKLNSTLRTCLALAVFLSVFGATQAAGTASGTQVAEKGWGAAHHLVMAIVYACVALVFSFLCSVAEAVLLSISPSYIAHLDQEGKREATLLREMKHNIDRSLAAILTLNTIAHTVGAGGAGAEWAAFSRGKYVNLSMIVLTLLILFFSEIIPKTVGALYWRSLATMTARFVKTLCWLLYPLIVVSEQLTYLLTKGEPVHVFSRDEFAALADIGAAKGQLDPKESRILKNLFRLPELSVTDIMTPRTVMFALQQDRTVRDVLAEHPEMTFSRIPIYGSDRDDIQGFVLRTDILLNDHRHNGKAYLRDLKREMRAVEQKTSLTHALEEMLDNRAHILLVVDRYGGTQGIVTLEDLVETLIGIEIVDEADRIDDMRKLARKQWQERMERLGIDVLETDPDAEGPGTQPPASPLGP